MEGTMKSNKGLTLIALIVYIIALSITIGGLSTLLKYFYRNTNETTISAESSEQYTRLATYITDDINSRKSENYNWK